MSSISKKIQTPRKLLITIQRLIKAFLSASFSFLISYWVYLWNLFTLIVMKIPMIKKMSVTSSPQKSRRRNIKVLHKSSACLFQTPVSINRQSIVPIRNKMLQRRNIFKNFITFLWPGLRRFEALLQKKQHTRKKQRNQSVFMKIRE